MAVSLFLMHYIPVKKVQVIVERREIYMAHRAQNIDWSKSYAEILFYDSTKTEWYPF